MNPGTHQLSFGTELDRPDPSAFAADSDRRLAAIWWSVAGSVAYRVAMTWKTVGDTAAFGVCALACFTLFSLVDGGSPDFQLVLRLTFSALVVRVLLLLVRGSMRWWRERRAGRPGLPPESYAG